MVEGFEQPKEYPKIAPPPWAPLLHGHESGASKPNGVLSHPSRRKNSRALLHATRHGMVEKGIPGHIKLNQPCWQEAEAAAAEAVF